jgi:hypothetical protein
MDAAEVDAASVCAGPLVTAIVDREDYGAVAFAVTHARHASTTYARARPVARNRNWAGLRTALTF